MRIANICHSRQPWPEDTKIKSLRVNQVLPLSVASAASPHNTGLQIPQGSDSINLARAVLGTVRVYVKEGGEAQLRGETARPTLE